MTDRINYTATQSELARLRKRVSDLELECAAHKGNSDANYKKWVESQIKLSTLVAGLKNLSRLTGAVVLSRDLEGLARAFEGSDAENTEAELQWWIDIIRDNKSAVFTARLIAGITA